MTEPCDLSATEARRLIGCKRLSPIELVDSCIARIEMVNPIVNAVVAECYDRARVEARAAEDVVDHELAAQQEGQAGHAVN